MFFNHFKVFLILFPICLTKLLTKLFNKQTNQSLISEIINLTIITEEPLHRFNPVLIDHSHDYYKWPVLDLKTDVLQIIGLTWLTCSFLCFSLSNEPADDKHVGVSLQQIYDIPYIMFVCVYYIILSFGVTAKSFFL